MDGIRHPVGDEPTNVYWKRRLAVVVAIVVLALLVWWVFSALGSSSTPSGTPTTDSSVSTSPSTSPTADLNRACTSNDIKLVTEPTSTSFAGDTKPTFTVTATQTGESPCKFSTTADSELLIMSGDDRIYSSTDCTDDKTFEDHEYLMQPGDKQEIALTWDRTRSAKGCADVSAVPKPGTYKATVTIGGIEAKPATFQLS